MSDARESVTAETPYVEVRDLVAHYEGAEVIHGLSFDIAEGQHLSLVGPSGCGKTTTLRCIAGLERPTSGEIRVGGRTVFSSRQGINVAAEKRGLSMVFQSYAIWPHMTVFKNVAYGLSAQKVRGEALRTRVMDMLRLVDLEELGDRRATALSGGQQQRIALARSYAPRPRALLLDEPLSNLDARLRVRMRNELKDLQRELGITTIYVTHDQEEAMALSDKVIVMRAGQIEQEGNPIEIYNAPRTSFVADFVGAANIYRGRLERQPGGGFAVRCGDTLVQCAEPSPEVVQTAGDVLISIRRVHPELLSEARQGEANTWPARVKRVVMLGDVVEHLVTWAGGEMTVRTLPTQSRDEGEQVSLHVAPGHVIPMAS